MQGKMDVTMLNSTIILRDMRKELKDSVKVLKSITVFSQHLHKNHLNPFPPAGPFLLSRAQALRFHTKITSRNEAKYDSEEPRNNFT